MQLDRLLAAAESLRARVGVIGLGYVGLPVACVLAESGYNVIGVDVDARRVRAISQASNPIGGREPGLSELLGSVVQSGRFTAQATYDGLEEADIVLVAVDTPVEDDHVPRFRALQEACRSLGGVIQDGVLLVVESTIAPGTMEMVVRPALAAGGKRNGTVLLGHCPERVMPGRLLRNLRTMDRVVGGESPAVCGVMVAMYTHYVEATLTTSDLLTAEIVKTAENAYRDVNIAFANQLALICQDLGANAWRVRELVNQSPGRNVLLPGGGVGGHCIPKDSWLLAANVPQEHTTLLAAARAVNDSMPRNVTVHVLDCLRAVDISPAAATVALLGYAYMDNSDDTRNSPSAAVVNDLISAGCSVRVHDPMVTEYRSDLVECLRGADCAVLMVAHDEYVGMDLVGVQKLMRHAALVDARALFASQDPGKIGFYYRAIGVGAPPFGSVAKSHPVP